LSCISWGPEKTLFRLGGGLLLQQLFLDLDAAADRPEHFDDCEAFVARAAVVGLRFRVLGVMRIEDQGTGRQRKHTLEAVGRRHANGDQGHVHGVEQRLAVCGRCAVEHGQRHQRHAACHLLANGPSATGPRTTALDSRARSA